MTRGVYWRELLDGVSAVCTKTFTICLKLRQSHGAKVAAEDVFLFVKSLKASKKASQRRNVPELSCAQRRANLDDPLFRINHTAAKVRHDLSRTARKVWVTTKKAKYLQAHLDLTSALITITLWRVDA